MTEQRPLFARLSVAAWGIPLIIIVICLGSWVFALFVALVAAIALFEFYSLAETRHLNPQTFPAVLLAAIAVFVSHFLSAGNWLALMFLLAVLLAFIEIRFGEREGLRDLPVTIFGWIYIPLLLGTLVYVRNAAWNDLQPSAAYTLYLVSSIWICDTAAYFVGSAIGKHPLFKRVSPHKTMEGAIAGFLFSLGTVYVFYLLFPGLLSSLIHYLIIGVLVGIFSQIGDLVESIFKRDVGVKDSSAILPGHGGFFDRFGVRPQ